MGDPWGIGGFRGGGEKPNIKQIVKKKKKKKSVKKSEKAAKLEKSDIFKKMVWNALGTPRNTFKSQKSVKKT